MEQWFLKDWRLRLKLSQEQLAERAGTSKGYISDLESGKRPVPPGPMLQRLADALGVTTRQLFTGASSSDMGGVVPLVGYVGAGAEAHFYASVDEGLGEVKAPPNANKNTVAARVRGESLGPLLHGWLVYFDDRREPVTPDQIGELCVVGLPDGRVVVKKLQPSRTAGLYHLLSNADAPMLDQEVQWAALVTAMMPDR